MHYKLVAARMRVLSPPRMRMPHSTVCVAREKFVTLQVPASTSSAAPQNSYQSHDEYFAGAITARISAQTVS